MSGKSSQDDSNGDTTSSEGTPPPLPARPSALELLEKPEIPVPFRPQLQSKATTGVSRAEVQGHAGGANSGTTHISVRSSSPRSNTAYRQASRAESLYGDRASISSTAVLSACGPDFEPLFDDFIPDYAEGKQAKRGPGNTTGGSRENEEVSLFLADRDFEADFKREFNDVRTKTISEEQALHEWKTKLKHYLILSAAGKPIWSRHGDDGLISSYIGVLNTIISSYEDTKDHLRSFTAGETKFILLFKGPVQLVAISRLHESDSHLHAQLEALYMQVVSTLTMPSMERMFSSRPSTDLRRALQGTEKLLSALADGFTRGSPSTLLSALECLTMKKRHRDLIDSIFLTNRSPRLLYGLIVARGRLVSVVRPRKHSLHPGDLQLIFNMLFEAGGIRVRGGDNWIPLCLPAFNDKGYLYMFVSFLDGQTGDESRASEEQSGSNLNEEITILLISTSKDSFYELRKMRDDIAENLEKSGALQYIHAALRSGRPTCDAILSGTVLRHFLYKSRAHVQFITPSFVESSSSSTSTSTSTSTTISTGRTARNHSQDDTVPQSVQAADDTHLGSPLTHRYLLSAYHSIHAQIHARPVSLKIVHCLNATNVLLGWSTSAFELYAIAPAGTNRAALSHSANKIVEWARREEERLFIIGGAVF